MNDNYRKNCELLGKNVCYYRKLNRYTQKQLAKLIGRDRTHITKIEGSQAAASFQTLSSIAEAFQIPLYKLLEPRE